jgi:hypothetical protein
LISYLLVDDEVDEDDGLRDDGDGGGDEPREEEVGTEIFLNKT